MPLVVAAYNFCNQIQGTVSWLVTHLSIFFYMHIFIMKLPSTALESFSCLIPVHYKSCFLELKLAVPGNKQFLDFRLSEMLERNKIKVYLQTSVYPNVYSYALPPLSEAICLQIPVTGVLRCVECCCTKSPDCRGISFASVITGFQASWASSLIQECLLKLLSRSMLHC